MLAALYIHIPFCLKRCSYCDFFSELYRPEFAEKYSCAVKQEMALYQNHPVFSETGIGTIYFGGGTPSVLPVQSIEKIMEQVNTSFQINEACEITVEINPETVDLAYLQSLRTIGVNRLSIGAQSFSDSELKILGRIHNASQAIKSIVWARLAGFNNLSIDLIFAIPGQNLKDWERNLQQAIDLTPEHLSLYCLTIEPGTVLHKQVQSSEKHKADDETERVMYLMSIEIINQSGCLHYEISNFARPGLECRHNKKYWDGSPYLGLGPSAHSFWPNVRQWNVADLPKYFKLVSENEKPVHDSEELTGEQQIFEFIMLCLRTAEGINLFEYERRFGVAFEERYAGVIKELQYVKDTPLFRLDKNFFCLTPEGFVMYDEICSLFVSD